MWDSACDAIDAEVKRVRPLLEKWWYWGACELVQCSSYLFPGVKVPGFLVELLAIKLGLQDADHETQVRRAAKWISENCKFEKGAANE